MADTKRSTGLGRGLSALLDDGAVAAARGHNGVSEAALRLSDIVVNPTQPRRHFDPEALSELTDSVRARGVLQPILVRPTSGGRYEIVAGERRWRAAQAAQLHEIPAVIRELDDRAAFEIALIENVQRSDLNAIEEAEGYSRLVREHDHSQQEVAKLIGKSRSHVANLLRLLDLPDAVRDMLRDGSITMGHARAMLGMPDASTVAERVVAQGLSVRQVEALARQPRAPAVKKGARDSDTEALEVTLAEALGLPVKITGGTVSIAYATLAQLDLICEKLTQQRPSPRHEPRIRII